MPITDDISTAVYSELAGDDAVTALCTVYKGRKRPADAVNPSATVDVSRLEPGEGEGIWMCDVTVTVYADILANRAPDHETHASAAEAVRASLTDRTLDLDNAKSLPLIEGGSGGVDWDADHDGETRQDLSYGLVFVKFS